MALTPTIIQGALLSARAAGGYSFAGVNYDRLAAGIGLGVFQWGVGQPQNVALLGASTGVSGAGVVAPVTTKLIVPPNVGVMQAALVGVGMVGPLSQSLAVVIPIGVSQAIAASGQYSGVSAGVGVGSDVSKVTVANGASLIGILKGTLSATMGAGPALDQMITGLGIGIAALMLLGTGAGAVTGSPTVPPVPTIGVTTSVMV